MIKITDGKSRRSNIRLIGVPGKEQKKKGGKKSSKKQYK